MTDVSNTNEFREGVEAHCADQPLRDCPYFSTSEAADRWRQGWRHAAQLAARKPGPVNCNRALYLSAEPYPAICQRCGTAGLGGECVFYEQNTSGRGPVYTLKSYLTRPQLTEGHPPGIADPPHLKDNQSYADHPKTVGEARADRTESSSAWTPRDLLINLLRRIDAGDLDPTTLAVLWHDDKTKNKGWSLSSPDLTVGIGLCQLAAYDMLAESKG